MIERFALADELTCYYDRPSEPANVHLEVRVPGLLDPAAIRAAVGAVLASQPRIMARRRPATWQRGYHWEFPAPATTDPVLTADYADRDDLDRQRDAFLSWSPPLDVAPPLRFLVASGPGGDCLILNAHHAAFDGLSCLRLLREVAGCYRPDRKNARPVAGDGPVSAGPDAVPVPRAAQAVPAARTGDHPAGRSATGSRAWPAARIAPGPGGAPGRPGYGAHLMTWGGLALSTPLRPAGLRVNDLLITALMLTISDWNGARGGSRDQIKITMPVGDKAQAGSDGQWANLSRLTTVAARVQAGTLPGELAADVARQTRAAKERPGPQLDLASRVLAAVPVPVTVKNLLLRSSLRFAGPLLCDTSLVSNLGVLPALTFGTMTAAEGWFSTSAHMPRGLSLGAVTAGGALRLTFRYRRALMSGADAAEFGGRYLKALDQLAGQEAVCR
jgi:NRPS condensation-like uncharacterized protein